GWPNMAGASCRRARECAPRRSTAGAKKPDAAIVSSAGKLKAWNADERGFGGLTQICSARSRRIRFHPCPIAAVSAMTPIRIENVSKRFGTTVAVDGVTLHIEPGELFFLLGPSGCGKTTLLRMLAGFVQPDEGEIYFGDQRITFLPARARDAGMVFQTYALLPHMTVASNVAYGLQVRGFKRSEIA